MTIDEHISRQEAGELPEGYPVEIEEDGRSLRLQLTTWMGGSRSWVVRVDALAAIDSLERETVDHIREMLDAINKYRTLRGEEPL